MSKIAVIVCAAGASTRFAGKEKKPFVDIAGRPAFLRSVDIFLKRDDVKQIILAISPEDEESVKIRWGATLSFSGVKLSLGGTERFETVQKALALVKDDIDLVAVHDAARPCLTETWLDDVFALAAEKQAAMLACPINGTIKKVAEGRIIATIDRTGLYEAQTPQVFAAKLLKKAYANLPNLDRTAITDDANLVEALNIPVFIVETDLSNIKLTRKNDIQLAQAIINARPKPASKGPLGPYEEAPW
ncbi:MAG: 2-C-methyl-D-erythritol 4-phosphate cytidylyltransferase [Anaerohalosphaera sp.]|nr:2-C-methyl-D-erythritol 4-phosphate cytidylyltransferase [Anaerohalosphaera sp.]